MGRGRSIGEQRPAANLAEDRECRAWKRRGHQLSQPEGQVLPLQRLVEKVKCLQRV